MRKRTSMGHGHPAFLRWRADETVEAESIGSEGEWRQSRQYLSRWQQSCVGGLPENPIGLNGKTRTAGGSVLRGLGEPAECGAGVGKAARGNQAGDLVPGVWWVPGAWKDFRSPQRTPSGHREWPSEKTAQALRQSQDRDLPGAEETLGEAPQGAGLASEKSGDVAPSPPSSERTHVPSRLCGLFSP